MKGNKKGYKDEKKRIPVTALRRGLYTAIGSILFAGAVAAGLWLLPPGITTVEEPEYTYQAAADVSYRVKLLPSQLFSKEWLEEGGLYSTRLTDYIEVKFTADFAGASSDVVLGTYKITGIVEGYQEIKDDRKVIYERKFPIKGGKVRGNGPGGASVSEVVSVKLEPYKQVAEEAETILGATCARRFYVLFEGDFTSDTAYGKAEERFLLPLQIPIPKQDGFYEIAKPQAFTKTGQLTSAKEVAVTAGPVRILLISIWAALALALVIWARFFTRKPDEDESYRLQWKELIRKYGSRMVQLKQVDKKWEENGEAVSDMDNLVMISEELHRPVCYGLNESGLPQRGLLYVPDGEKGYVLCLKEPAATTLVVDEKEGSSIRNGRR